MKTPLLVILLMLWLPISWAGETPRIPTKDDVRDALARATAETRRVDRSAMGEQLDRVQQEASRLGGVDLAALVEQHNRVAENMVLPQRDVLKVFVSLSMPREALVRLGKDTNRAGGKLLFRGFHKDTLSEMRQALQFLNEAGVIGVEIDPESFKRYEVTKVPTYVVARVEESHEQEPACQAAGSCDESHFVGISGDVTLDYALDKMMDRAPKPFQPSIQEYLRRLGK